MICNLVGWKRSDSQTIFHGFSLIYAHDSRRTFMESRNLLRKAEAIRLNEISSIGQTDASFPECNIASSRAINVWQSTVFRATSHADSNTDGKKCVADTVDVATTETISTFALVNQKRMVRWENINFTVARRQLCRISFRSTRYSLEAVLLFSLYIK